MSHLSDIKPGQVIGRYEFLAPIAQGGMAAVWAARQRGSRGFSKVVAVKTMLPAISDDPRFEKMFLDEARIASHIRHPNVVQILDLGEENDILYLVMEWVDGESLSALRRRAAERDGIPQRLTMRIVADVCAGLHAAHELVDDEGRPCGLVHRDVSPQNVLVGYDGNVKILDFGVAKVAGRTADTTNIGHARGKPPYMAPEQALGKTTDRRADIFALGIIFYQLLVGRHPFRGENDIATLHNIISDYPLVPPSVIDPTVSKSIETIVLQALEREPSLRFQTAQEFERAIEAVLDTDLGRVRSEDIARLMVDRFGAAREDRRGAIRDAIRRADSTEQAWSVAESSQPNAAPAVEERRSYGELVSSDSNVRPHSSASSDLRLRPTPTTVEQHVVGAFDGSFGDTTPLEPIGRSHASRWWQVLVAMGIGAALAWMGSAMLGKTPKQTLRGGSATVVVPSAVPRTVPETSTAAPFADRGLQAPSLSGAAGEGLDLHRSASPRRPAASSTRYSAAASAKGQSGLPPVPSPGF